MPFIPKEEFDALPENVREIIREQHAYFRELLKQNGGTRTGSSRPRNVNLTIVEPKQGRRTFRTKSTIVRKNGTAGYRWKVIGRTGTNSRYFPTVPTQGSEKANYCMPYYQDSGPA